MKKSFAFIFFFCVSIPVNSSRAQVSDSMKLYITEAINIMQKNSLYASQVNWKEVHDTIQKIISISTNDSEAEEAVVWAFSQLKDIHGNYSGIDTFFQYKNPAPERKMSKAILAQYQKPRRVKILMLGDRIAYYKMPAVLIGSDTAKMKEWATLMMDSLCKLNLLNPKAYIIDLRMNNGGNSEPMWQVLKNIAGENNKTYEADANMQIVKSAPDSAFIAYQNSAIPDRTCSLSNAKNLPVAVLIGPGTASSGEIMALSFTTRKNTRLFGENSIGVANSTNGFIIRDKGYLLFSVSYVADANKNVLTKKYISPDVFVSSENDNYEEPARDETVQAAMKWLHGFK